MLVSDDEQSDLTGGATDSDDLGRMVARGLRWSLVSNLTARVGTVLMGVVLARLLAPSEYGVYTVAFVALIILSNINDLGIETALIRHPGRVDDVGRTAVTVMGGSSVVLFVAAFLGAPFADAFNAPDATGVIRLLTVCVLINGAFAMQSALLTREFQQGRRAIADLTGLFVSIGVTVALAAKGYGPWSLAWGRVVGNFVNGLLHFVLARARYRPGYDREIARSLLCVGMPIAGASLFAEAVNDVDYVIVSRVLGATSLGLYLMAYNLSSWPVTTLSMSVTRVSVPGFARLQTIAMRCKPRSLARSGCSSGSVHSCAPCSACCRCPSSGSSTDHRGPAQRWPCASSSCSAWCESRCNWAVTSSTRSAGLEPPCSSKCCGWPLWCPPSRSVRRMTASEASESAT